MKRIVAGKGRWGIIVTSIPEGHLYCINVGSGLWLSSNLQEISQTDEC